MSDPSMKYTSLNHENRTFQDISRSSTFVPEESLTGKQQVDFCQSVPKLNVVYFQHN